MRGIRIIHAAPESLELWSGSRGKEESAHPNFFFGRGFSINAAYSYLLNVWPRQNEPKFSPRYTEILVLGVENI